MIITLRLLFCLSAVCLLAGCASDAPDYGASERPFWEQVEKIVIAPKSDQERVIEGADAEAFLKRFGPNSLDEMEMESIGYWAEGYIYMAGKRHPIRYAEVAGSKYPGVLVIQGKRTTLRLRQYR